jgi:hypothetical protein
MPATLYSAHLAHRALHLRVGAGVQVDRAEALHFGAGAQRVEVLAGGGEQRARGVLADPALQRIAGAGQVELLVREAVDRHAPRIRCRRRGMDQQDAGRALAQRFLELVGPAAVPGEGLAAEALRFGGGGLRVVDHRHQQLAFHIHALEVVPAFVRCVDAVADEDDGRVQPGVGACRWRWRTRSAAEGPASMVLPPASKRTLLPGRVFWPTSSTFWR